MDDNPLRRFAGFMVSFGAHVISAKIKSKNGSNTTSEGAAMVENFTKYWLDEVQKFEKSGTMLSLLDILQVIGCDYLFISKCESANDKDKLMIAAALKSFLSTNNQLYEDVVKKGLEPVIQMACQYTTESVSSLDQSRIGTAIIDHLSKHSKEVCQKIIRIGGRDAILLQCEAEDVQILRHCASALLSFCLYSGADNQQEDLIKPKILDNLFLLASNSDDNIKYEAYLSIVALMVNNESMPSDILKSLPDVERFITNRVPSEFAESLLPHSHQPRKNWLQQLVPLLNSKGKEAETLVAFHFCMEAAKSQNNKIFREIGAIEGLKKVVNSSNHTASKFATEALHLLGDSALKAELTLRNFTPFLDVTNLEGGKFNIALLEKIKQAKHFILVLTPKALDRCMNDNKCEDWVHREIVTALESKRNIIPITDNFNWPEPEKLPEDMRAICHFNGVRWIHDFQDACYNKLEEFMKSEVGI